MVACAARSALALTDNDLTIFNNCFSSALIDEDDETEQADDAEQERNGACLEKEDRPVDEKEDRPTGDEKDERVALSFDRDEEEATDAEEESFVEMPSNDSHAELLRNALNTIFGLSFIANVQMLNVVL